MSKEEIFQYFYTNSANLSIRSIMITLLAGLVIGAIIFVTYYISYKGVAYNIKFNISLVVIMLISIVIMLMISSNIVISLGMVGALSIVRFRTAIKDSRDTVFIFWAIAEGLSIGSQNFKLSLVTTLFIAVVLAGSTYLPKMQTKYLVIVSGSDELDEKRVEHALKRAAKYYRLRSSSKSNGRKEIIYEITLGKNGSVRAVSTIADFDGVNTFNLVAESGENVG
ncbi:MAG: DUF4956 domain-containing protein [Clostridia bacterium]|nr:DUF4956 domain-containing protein [Clostridia bacterium]